MSHAIIPAPAYPIATVVVPDDGDDADAASVQVGFQACSDGIATHSARLGGATDGSGEWSYPSVRSRIVRIPCMSIEWDPVTSGDWEVTTGFIGVTGIRSSIQTSGASKLARMNLNPYLSTGEKLTSVTLRCSVPSSAMHLNLERTELNDDLEVIDVGSTANTGTNPAIIEAATVTVPSGGVVVNRATQMWWAYITSASTGDSIAHFIELHFDESGPCHG